MLLRCTREIQPIQGVADYLSKTIMLFDSHILTLLKEVT